MVLAMLSSRRVIAREVSPPRPAAMGRSRRLTGGERDEGWKAGAAVLSLDLAPAATIADADTFDGGVWPCPERRLKNGWRRWSDRLVN
jgi:hypothetical protein